jgi:AraC family transcriptional regulator of adaptative response/methylated-DNA-[protein]-cysteine methyltransferase
MKNSMKDFKCIDNHTMEMMEGWEINVRDKRDMKKRIADTQLADSPNAVQLERWGNNDIGTAINYRFSESAFGEILIGATAKGVCYMGFTNGDREKTLPDLKRRFVSSTFEEKNSGWISEMIIQMNNPEQHLLVHLHLKGSDFQFSIWKKLLKVPLGGLTTYAQLGGSSKIARAAGTAVGSNPVCYVLPCHRVIHGDGSFDNYFWGANLKQRLLTWEAAEPSFSLA